MADDDQTTQDQAERIERERRAENAQLSTSALLKEASDSDLRHEMLRCRRAFEQPRRVWSVSHERVLAHLDDGLTKLPSYADAALARVRKESTQGPVSPTTLASAFNAYAAAKAPAGFRSWLEAGLKPDGSTITEEDLRAKASRERLALDERAVQIHNELERRDLKRRQDRLERVA